MMDCNRCGIAFTLKKSLRRHLRNKHGIFAVREKIKQLSFDCQLCQKQFRYKNSLKRHMMSIHATESEKVLFECNICGEHFNRKYNLSRHMSGIHKESDINDNFFAMAKRLFTHDMDEILIQKVRTFRPLYGHENKDFRNVQIKNNIWQKIGETIGLNAETCKNRWKDIRDNVFKIQRKQKSNGSSTASILTRWPLCERLQFLNHLNSEKSTFSTISDDSLNLLISEVEVICESDDENIHSEDNVDVRTSSSFENNNFTYAPKLEEPKKNFNEIDKCSQKCVELLEHLVNKTQKEDDIDLFMKSAAQSIKKFPDSIVAQIKIDILNLISIYHEHTYNKSFYN